MNPDNVPGVASNNMMSGQARGRDNLVQMQDHPSFNFALAFAWLVALFSILATMYFWWLNRNIKDDITAEQTKKTSIESELSGAKYASIEKQANDFKASVSALSAAKKARFPMSTFLPEFYTKVTNDGKISSLSVDTTGNFAFTGETKNYRSVADLLMALKSWNKLTKVDLQTVSMSTSGQSGGSKAQFTIAATIKADGIKPAQSGAGGAASSPVTALGGGE